ncbi:MAG: MFS transporter [Clostridiales bacterium]|nr:MFS transporter [Clostridiales bacterium]
MIKLTKTQKKQRLLMMVFGAFAIFFTGYPHVWSVYQPYVMEQAGWTQGQASMCFYLALATFVFGNIVGGRMQDKKSPRLVIFIGGGIFTAGILLSAFLIVPSPIPIYLTYGVMQGFGQGMIYTTIISTAQKWFPGRTGFASGVVVTANGLCGFFLAPLSRTLLEAEGPKTTFLLVGGAIALSWILCSIFFYVPDRKWREAAEREQVRAASGSVSVKKPKEYTSSEMMRTKSFYLLLATMLLGLMSYFILSPVSQTYQTELGIPASLAVSAVMLGSIVNAGTRLVLPSIADKVGRAVCIKGVLAVSIAAMAVLAVSGSYAVTAAVIAMYGCYGGIMGSFPSFTSSIFGMEHSGENYGYVMFGIVIATIGAPLLTGMVTGQGYGMRIVFAIGTGFAVAAFICMTILKRELGRMTGSEED